MNPPPPNPPPAPADPPGSGPQPPPAARGALLYKLSKWSAPIVAAADRTYIVSLHNRLDKNIVAKLTAQSKNITDPIALRALVVREALSSEATRKDLAVVRSVIASKGGNAHMREHPDLPQAILHEVYARHGQGVASGDVQDYAADLFVKEIGKGLYQDRVADELDKLSIVRPDKDIASIANLMQARRVALDSPRFPEELFRSLEEVQGEAVFDPLFAAKGAEGVLVADELDAKLSDTVKERRRRQAIRLLQRIGVDPKKAKDPDWIRAALAMVGSDGPGRDVMALASYGLGTDIDDLDRELPLPMFDDEVQSGLLSESIRNCADLYYIHQFERLGVFRVVDAIALRFFDRMNLGLGVTARKLYVYIKRRPSRFPEEDRRRLTEAIFEDSENGRGAFKPLLGRMVEALIEYTEARNAGELFTSGRYDGSSPSVYTRSAVIRAIENLQRYLSDNGGGITPFLTQEAGAQLMDAFEILQSEDLQKYFGGSFRSGMWAIIEQVGKELDHRTPPVDLARTLAVHGRRIIQWLADNTNNAGVLTDTDLDTLSEHVQNWLAAYRRPAEEPNWLGDDEYQDEEEEDQYVEEAVGEAKRNAYARREEDILEPV